jgi:hypothetical protein
MARFCHLRSGNPIIKDGLGGRATIPVTVDDNDAEREAKD